MQDLIERLSGNCYSKLFVTFQVVLPVQFFILHTSHYANHANFGKTGPQIFVLFKREPELSRFFSSYHNSSRAELYQSIYFNLILDIPRPILNV